MTSVRFLSRRVFFILFFMSCIPSVVSGQQRWTKQQIEAADAVIFTTRNTERDIQNAAKVVSRILNISEKEAHDYLEQRAANIVMGWAASAAIAEERLKQYKEEVEAKCVGYIEKLYDGVLLTKEEIDVFSEYDRILEKQHNAFYSKDVLFLEGSKFPIMRNNKIVFGDGTDKVSSSSSGSLYWNTTITLVGAITDGNRTITQFTASYENDKCIILWNQAVGNAGKVSIMEVYRVRYGDSIEPYVLYYGTMYQSPDKVFYGFTQEAVTEWQNDSTYITNNMQQIVDNAVLWVHNNKPDVIETLNLPQFDLSKVRSKKAKPLPEEYKPVMSNLRYIATQGNYEVWGIGSPSDCSTEGIKDYLLGRDKFITKYNKTIIFNRPLSVLWRWDYVFREYYAEAIPKALSNNKYYIGQRYVQGLYGKIPKTLFLVDKSKRQIFLVENISAWGSRKIKKIEPPAGVEYLFK